MKHYTDTNIFFNVKSIPVTYPGFWMWFPTDVVPGRRGSEQTGFPTKYDLVFFLLFSKKKKSMQISINLEVGRWCTSLNSL